MMPLPLPASTQPPIPVYFFVGDANSPTWVQRVHSVPRVGDTVTFRAALIAPEMWSGEDRADWARIEGARYEVVEVLHELIFRDPRNEDQRVEIHVRPVATAAGG